MELLGEGRKQITELCTFSETHKKERLGMKRYWAWRDSSVINSLHYSWRGAKFVFQHPGWAAHNSLKVQLQRFDLSDL